MRVLYGIAGFLAAAAVLVAPVKEAEVGSGYVEGVIRAAEVDAEAEYKSYDMEVFERESAEWAYPVGFAEGECVDGAKFVRIVILRHNGEAGRVFEGHKKCWNS